MLEDIDEMRQMMEDIISGKTEGMSEERFRYWDLPEGAVIFFPASKDTEEEKPKK